MTTFTRAERLNGLLRSLSKRVQRAPLVGPIAAHLANRTFARFFVADLHALNDLLAEADFADRYWVWAGMLLGYAREGRLLAHDRDADFGILPEDVDRLLALIPTLRRAGFTPVHLYRNSAGEITELTFKRHLAKFEFFVFAPVGDRLHYTVYGYPPDHLVEIESAIARQPLVPFDFVGRTWRKPADHEQELAAMYGEWRVPQRGWNYLTDDKAMIATRPWTNTDVHWRP